MRAGILAMHLYPFVCLLMLRMIALDMSMAGGIRFLSRNLWRWFSWPLGILFWIALLFHGVIMSMSHVWGETIHGEAIREMASHADYALIATGFLVMASVGLFIIARVNGFDRRRIGKIIDETLAQYKALSWGVLVFYIIILLIVLPIFLFIALVLFFVIPFYLYCIIWGIAFSFASREKTLPRLLPENRGVGIAAYIVFAAYSFLMAFFYDSITAHLVGISASDPDYIAPWFAAFFIFAIHYLPYRIFFALRSGGNLLSWATFVIGAGIVYYETWLRFVR